MASIAVWLAVRVGPSEGTWTFDRGRLQVASDLSGGRSAYGYDAAGRLASVVDAYGGKTQYIYEALGRLARVTLADGVEIVYTYDDKRHTVEVKRGGLRRPSAAD